MPEVYKLGISINNNQQINEVNSIDDLANQGVIGDRHLTEVLGQDNILKEFLRRGG